ncbi:hypothetical protein LTS15_010518 [Exophiala xenobiotica]|nr:hypothetical protein LTS15_010518 [Exophiala xenobiotica]
MKRLKALDARGYGPNIYGKVVEWFAIIGPELQNPAMRTENVYNMDETGLQLSVLGTQKVLVSRDDPSSASRLMVDRSPHSSCGHQPPIAAAGSRIQP